MLHFRSGRRKAHRRRKYRRLARAYLHSSAHFCSSCYIARNLCRPLCLVAVALCILAGLSTVQDRPYRRERRDRDRDGRKARERDRINERKCSETRALFIHIYAHTYRHLRHSVIELDTLQFYLKKKKKKKRER
ncbi:hypothetical protein PUN28_012134 [Cardiocondyla obscurior]|uniref:Uncharacterized protein n=1 Tax=Cardiocondyla obscurior TaxID=286306 RepID=A0AAW2F9L2_9HYME